MALRWVHHKVRVRQAWALINGEREGNKRVFARAAETFGTQGRQWRARLGALESPQAHGAGDESGPGQITWAVEAPAYAISQWQAVQRGGSTALMLPDQVREVEELYTDLDWLNASRTALVTAVDAARRYAEAHPSRAHAQPAAEEIALARAVWMAHCRLGADMLRFHELHTDFLPVPAVDECDTAGDALRKSTAD